MKIREGAYYRTRGGDDKPGTVVGPMQYSSTSKCWYVRGWSWTASGARYYGVEGDMDLISEVYVSDTPPTLVTVRTGSGGGGGGMTPDTPPDAPKGSMLKPQDWRRLKPIEPSPETKTMRDEFAGYAIIGLLAAGDCHAFNRDEMAVEAYRQADAMLEARQCWK